jgi:hypothetical protein
MLIYLAIPDTLYIAEMKEVRRVTPHWQNKYGLRRVRNKHWTTMGIAVPEDDFASVCRTVRRLT